MTRDGEPTGPGFAIHPYIVITSPNFIRSPCGVVSYMGIHHAERYEENLDVGVVELRDPIFLINTLPGDVSLPHYSYDGMAFARHRTYEWVRTRVDIVHLGFPLNPPRFLH